MNDNDLISRAAALRMLDENGVVFRGEIEKIPTMNAAPVVHARWIDENPDLYLNPRMRCSVCEQVEMPLVGWNYCPNCGAKMDEERMGSE